MMSYVEQMYIYLVKHSDKYSYKTIEYTKSLVETIENEKGLIYEYFQENNISIDRFLDEALALSEYRLKTFGRVELTKHDFDRVLDYLSIESDINNLVLFGHIDRYVDEDIRSYIPDEYAVEFIKNKYDVDLEVGGSFDYTLFYERPDDPIANLFDDICLN